MKKILIHIGSLRAGGAEKSLVSLLNVLPTDNYSIDLLLLDKSGLFLPLIPTNVNVIEAPHPYKSVSVPISNLNYFFKHNPKCFLNKIKCHLPLYNDSELSYYQNLWKNWKSLIPVYNKEYDVAISYLEGITNYFVIDKVKAKKKILWIHNEYEKLLYNRDFDLPYFQKADAVVTISELCRENLEKSFPAIKSKFCILENITDPNFIKKLSQKEINDQIFNCNENQCLKLLSIGRLSPQKNYSLAILAAKILKDKGIKFKWFIIGDGPLKQSLENQIRKLELDGYMYLLGLRSNPYSYMKQSDIIVQTSKFEGKSIAIDEAKILCKPIVSTNYATVFDLLENGINGIITQMTPESVAQSIQTLIFDVSLREKLITNLQNCNNNNLAEVQNYIKLLE